MRSTGMNIVEEIRNDINGAAALTDWLGDLDPVHEMVALFRAERCVQANNGEPCPWNVEPNWWERHAKHPVAQFIRKEMELKTGMNLRTGYDDKLHMCKLCGCALQLKVWVPMRHLEGRTNKDKFAKAPTWCWVKKEMNL